MWRGSGNGDNNEKGRLPTHLALVVLDSWNMHTCIFIWMHSKIETVILALKFVSYVIWSWWFFELLACAVAKPPLSRVDSKATSFLYNLLLANAFLLNHSSSFPSVHRISNMHSHSRPLDTFCHSCCTAASCFPLFSKVSSYRELSFLFL